ncbi:conserved hypothetical protein [Xenorhabdus nematophila F1]|uniref:Uncharacterized protein n=1 Tax=Xenorhabdus nematophila (strain ATCC 19061 / DSM 3370 / CCUG 14189 / LMG 1036 / NCIMB 9965 / AN6) TaxID=406817 RepID=D3VJM4_XENNA|nr:hypothetical protein XNC1_0709 [Xenorhabdus nematophila ATCC 19061]CCW30858.1 conserved hypothetical protein [Xenorhabdus nematophila F1]
MLFTLNTHTRAWSYLNARAS